jgi:predicted AAA+ superfamily ATPase
MFSRITLLAKQELIPGSTLVFIDEVQEAKEVVTAVKYLAQQTGFRFVLSGSLLGVELRDVRSVPVGYLDVVEMYPLDFEEFSWAAGVSQSLWGQVAEAFEKREAVPDYLHDRLNELFHQYLVVGGMPAAVEQYLTTHNLQRVRSLQSNLIQLNRWDISKYNKRDSLVIKDIYDLIPAELNQQNKRFTITDLNKQARFNRYQESFVWLADAGVALPTFNVTETKYPLKLNQQSNLFKLFMADVGLLTSTFMAETSLKALMGELDMNYGAIYENYVAQELKAAGFGLYYYRGKKHGELDFVVETRNGSIVPIEVKSGKTYKRHAALASLLKANPDLLGYVFCEANVQLKGQVLYLPMYMVGMLGTIR